MKKFLMASLILTIHTFCVGQIKERFTITDTFLKDKAEWERESRYDQKTDAFYEDANYLVSKSCSGEWGGSIKFKNKQSGIEYSCEATCPVVVTKLGKTYFVTNSLRHLSGTCNVLEISDPDALVIFNLPEPRAVDSSGQILGYVGDDEAKSKIGSKTLVDTVGILALATFEYDRKLYHVITNYEKTFLARIEHGRFVTIDTIFNDGLWSDERSVVQTKDNHTVAFVYNGRTNGFIDIYRNRIRIVRY
jgi:hypothetical protein